MKQFIVEWHLLFTYLTFYCINCLTTLEPSSCTIQELDSLLAKQNHITFSWLEVCLDIGVLF